MKSWNGWNKCGTTATEMQTFVRLPLREMNCADKKNHLSGTVAALALQLRLAVKFDEKSFTKRKVHV